MRPKAEPYQFPKAEELVLETKRCTERSSMVMMSSKTNIRLRISSARSGSDRSIKDDLEITSNVRMKDVEEAQQRIVGIIRGLEEAGPGPKSPRPGGARPR